MLLRTTTADAIGIVKPIVNAIDRHPDKVQWLLLGLMRVEDRQPNTQQSWSLWKQFAERVRKAAWLARIDSEHARGHDMILAVFLGSSWKDDGRHWLSVEGHAGHVHTLFESMPASSTVLDAYVRFLYNVGEQSLPEAFIRIASCLQNGDTPQLLRKGNTVFLLEVLLQRYVYGKPLDLKRRTNLRKAVLLLLDLLVENGSSAAFRMRDDFVTPMSTGRSRTYSFNDVCSASRRSHWCAWSGQVATTSDDAGAAPVPTPVMRAQKIATGRHLACASS